jgi:hypothetical protein
MKLYDDYLRWLYRGGRPNRFARLQNRVSAIAFATGIWPKRAAALEVRGRRTGRDKDGRHGSRREACQGPAGRLPP